VLLITHQLGLLPQFDFVGVMRKGTFDYFGPWKDSLYEQYFPSWQHSKNQVEKKSKVSNFFLF
jgi:ABC-type protease/lipase transport system fused ATPase/permease subunit